MCMLFTLHTKKHTQKKSICINSRRNFSHFSALERSGGGQSGVGGVGFSFFFYSLAIMMILGCRDPMETEVGREKQQQQKIGK